MALSGGGAPEGKLEDEDGRKDESATEGDLGEETGEVHRDGVMSSPNGRGLAAGFAGFLDHGGEAVEFFVADFIGCGIEEGGNEFFAGAFEEVFEELGEDGLAGLGGGDDGLVDVTRAVCAVGKDAFFFHDAEEGANGRVAGRCGEAGLDFGGGAFA
jgi:hypothetical protein